MHLAWKKRGAKSRDCDLSKASLKFVPAIALPWHCVARVLTSCFVLFISEAKPSCSPVCPQINLSCRPNGFFGYFLLYLASGQGFKPPTSLSKPRPRPSQHLPRLFRIFRGVLLPSWPSSPLPFALSRAIILSDFPEKFLVTGGGVRGNERA